MKSISLFLTMLFWYPVVFASKDACDLTDAATQNLSTLLTWCDRHHVSDDDCTELLDASTQLTPHEFAKKLVQKESDLKAKSLNVQANTTEDITDAIPKKPKEAFLQLQNLANSNDNAFFKTIDFHKNAQKHFDTLTNAEIRNVYEIVDKIKTSPNRTELIKALQSKAIESLGNKETKLCRRPNVMAVRLSRGARMCFQIEDGHINILCIGQGEICYNH